MDIRDLAQQCIQVQDACNLSGVASLLGRATEALWEQARAEGHGTKWVNQHPVCVMLTNKLASLTCQYWPWSAVRSCDEAARFSSAYQWCVSRSERRSASWDYQYPEAA